MSKTRLPSWEDHTIWRQIYAALPEALRPPEPLAVQEEWRALGRFDVHIDRWIAPSARARVILLHGGGGHGRLLGAYAWRLAMAGFETICPDLPGFGLTLTPKRRRIVYDDWREVAAALIEDERERGGSLFVLGHSMGGMLAYDAIAMTDAADGLIATCLLDPTLPEVRQSVMRYRWMAGPAGLGVKFTPSLFNGIPMSMAMLGDMKAITNDPDITRLIIKDTVAGGNTMPFGFLRSWLMSPPLLPAQSFEYCPVLLAHPELDHWTDSALSEAVYAGIPTDKRFIRLQNAGHFPIEAPGYDQLDTAAVNFMSAITEHRPIPIELV
jgi:alpha-beta hydrolase superfamily lysophospholipase